MHMTGTTESKEKISKADMELLERFFETCEIKNQLIQSNSKRIKAMEKRGMAEHVEFTLPGRFPVTISGWRLTLKGHMTFCMNCK